MTVVSQYDTFVSQYDAFVSQYNDTFVSQYDAFMTHANHFRVARNVSTLGGRKLRSGLFIITLCVALHCT